MSHSPRSFDPVAGCQRQSTGVLAGFLILALMAAYAYYKTWVVPGGGTGVPVFSWLPSRFQTANVHRDYFDIFGITLTAFCFMVSWEFFTTPAQRLTTFVMTLVGLSLFLMVALGSSSGDPYLFSAGGLTRLEGLLLLWMAACVTSWLSHPVPHQDRMPFSKAMRTAFWRWFAGLIVFALFWGLVFVHPFYRNNYYENWRLTCNYLFFAYAFLGFPYALVTNWLRGGCFEHRSDPCFVFLLLLRNAARTVFLKRSFGLWRTLKNARVKIALRDILVKIFFVPLMVVFLFSECGHFFSNFSGVIREPAAWRGIFPNMVYGAVYHSIFVMDVALCLLGYLSSSRWLANKSRSVEPTVGGWLVAVACYPPFNDVMSQYLPYDGIRGVPLAFLQTPTVEWTLKGFTILLFVVYVWASMAFGLRFSNLTNRGIITRGPYAVIRHPAYISKNLAWWTENIRSFSSPIQFVFLVGWNVIYCLRAITEERHLNADPDYRAYSARVKYRFIPGIW